MAKKCKLEFGYFIYKKCSKPFFDLLRIIPIHLIILKYCRQLPFQSKLAHCTSSCGRPLVLSLLLRDPVQSQSKYLLYYAQFCVQRTRFWSPRQPWSRDSQHTPQGSTILATTQLLYIILLYNTWIESQSVHKSQIFTTFSNYSKYL